MDFTDNSISLISYRSSKILWSLQVNLNPWTLADVNVPELIVSIGNQNPLGQQECSWLGNIQSIFYYNGVTAKSLGLNYRVLQQMMKTSDQPILFLNTSIASSFASS